MAVMLQQTVVVAVDTDAFPGTVRSSFHSRLIRTLAFNTLLINQTYVIRKNKCE
jgi:hypothetical protein